MTYAKRIQICGLTKNDLNGNDTLPPVITSEQFVLAGNYISDDDLDKIIPNAYGLYADAVAFKALSEKKEVTVSPERIPELKEYEQDYSYNIGDIIISKPKVARCLAVIEQSNLCNGLSREQKIFNAMIYGSSLDEEQLKAISNIFGDKIQKTREI